MKKLFLAVIIFMLPGVVWSHPGKTDPLGGHKCYKDCEKWELLFGEYHLHDKDGRPIRVAKKVKKKRASDVDVIEEPLIELPTAEQVVTQGLVPAAVPPIPPGDQPAEASVSVSPWMLLLLILLLLLLLIRRRGREEH